MEGPQGGWPREESPFHPGEWALQARAGMRERLERSGRRVIRDYLPEQHRELFAQLPLLLVGTLDAERSPWASVLVGPPGFVSTPDARALSINALPRAGDPLQVNLAAGVPIGILGIQLETRRRNRANGVVNAVRADGFDVRVLQSFGNCPQYIQSRAGVLVGRSSEVATSHSALREDRQLSPEAAALISRADTFFIATAAPDAGGADAVAGCDIS